MDAHIHMMAFEFLGGGAHCGRPWHRYGVTVALVDCPGHGPDGRGAVLENVLWNDPAHGHDTVGWPTFRDWPHQKSLTHEQTYYRWLERAWRGGLRIYVNLLVDNAVLCEVYPIGRRNSCNEMDSVRLQARRLRELENYIDAQHGGPGKGWFRIVDDSVEARQVINQGKLAVIQGIEVSRLFDCREQNDQPECTREQIDPDHMSVEGRDALLNIVESKRYSGIVSSHSWSSPDAYPRIYKLGGFVAPYAGDSTEFVEEWKALKPQRNPRYYFGFGYGADMNGFGTQGAPRGPEVPNPVRYPFKSFDGQVTIDKQRSGERVYDINVDGVAHYGLYPDWIEDLRVLAGQEIVEDMGRGSEAYLQMWERAEGVARRRCQPARSHIGPRGIGHVRLGASARDVLFQAGQPKRRVGRVYRYCLRRRGDRRRGRMATVFTQSGRSSLIFTSGPNQRIGRRIGPGTKAPRRARRLGGGLRIRRASRRSFYVFGVRRGKTRFVALASRRVARKERRLRAHLRLAGVRKR